LKQGKKNKSKTTATFRTQYTVTNIKGQDPVDRDFTEAAKDIPYKKERVKQRRWQQQGKKGIK